MLPPELFPRYSPHNDLLSLPLSENAHAGMRTVVFQCLGVFTRKAVWFYGCRQIRFRIIRAYKNPKSGNRIGGYIIPFKVRQKSFHQFDAICIRQPAASALRQGPCGFASSVFTDFAIIVQTCTRSLYAYVSFIVNK